MLDPEIVGRMLGRRRACGPLDELSPRERDVLAAMAEGKSNRGIGEILHISPRTVNKHLEQIFVKLGVENRASAAARATLAGSRPPASSHLRPVRALARTEP